MFKLFLVLVRVGGVVIFGGAYLGVLPGLDGRMDLRRRMGRWLSVVLLCLT